MKSLLLLSLLVAATSAHLCLVGPHQRGTMDDVNTQGARLLQYQVSLVTRDVYATEIYPNRLNYCKHAACMCTLYSFRIYIEGMYEADRRV